MSGAPDSIEPVVGWRCWRVRDSDEGFVLTSVTSPVRWAPGLALEAGCDRAPEHRAPSGRCTCGVYAARGPDLVLGYLPPTIRAASTIIVPTILGYDTVMAVGRVSLWGTVVESDLGWRGQLAYPRELHIPAAVKHFRRGRGRRLEIFDSFDLARALATLYGVPATVTRSLRPQALHEAAGRMAA